MQTGISCLILTSSKNHIYPQVGRGVKKPKNFDHMVYGWCLSSALQVAVLGQDQLVFRKVLSEKDVQSREPDEGFPFLKDP